VVNVDLSAPEHPTPELLALTPNCKIPVVDDGGLVIWKSGAILFHLAEKHGRLLPPTRRAAPRRSSTFSTRRAGSAPTWACSARSCGHYPWMAPVLGSKAPALMSRPRVVAWLERIAARPAVAPGMAVPAQARSWRAVRG